LTHTCSEQTKEAFQKEKKKSMSTASKESVDLKKVIQGERKEDHLSNSPRVERTEKGNRKGSR